MNKDEKKDERDGERDSKDPNTERSIVVMCSLKDDNSKSKESKNEY